MAIIITAQEELELLVLRVTKQKRQNISKLKLVPSTNYKKKTNQKDSDLNANWLTWRMYIANNVNANPHFMKSHLIFHSLTSSSDSFTIKFSFTFPLFFIPDFQWLSSSSEAPETLVHLALCLQPTVKAISSGFVINIRSHAEFQRESKGSKTRRAWHHKGTRFPRLFALALQKSNDASNNKHSQCYFLWRTPADPAAQRTHQEAALHLGQERGDQRVSRVGLLRRDRDGARVADEPRWGGARRLIPLIRIKGSLMIGPPVCPTCRNQPGPGGQRALSLSHLQPQRWHHRQRERGAGGEVWRWVWPSYAAVVHSVVGIKMAKNCNALCKHNFLLCVFKMCLAGPKHICVFVCSVWDCALHSSDWLHFCAINEAPD